VAPRLRGSSTYQQFPNGHKYPLGCNGYATAVVAGQTKRLYSGVGIFNWYHPSSPPQVLRPSRCPLERGGADILSHFRIQVAVSEAERPLCYVTAAELKRLKIYNGHTGTQRPFPNGKRSPFGCNGYVTATTAAGLGLFYQKSVPALLARRG
jgi:hypothetical protein